MVAGLAPHGTGDPRERPTESPENVKIGPNRWGERRVSDPILPTRRDEIGDAGDVVRLPGCRSGRAQDLEETALSGKLGDRPTTPDPTPKKRPQDCAGATFSTGTRVRQGVRGLIRGPGYAKVRLQPATAPGMASIWPCLFPRQSAQPERVLTFGCGRQWIFPSPV